ncbi:MAG: NAD(P)(+) transhydrogenase (Re/Si-specific) subunit beta [Gammaproteobacteria bacterium]
MNVLIQIAYFGAAVLFIVGLKRMSSPVTARDGIVWAGAGMLVAVLITFFWPDMQNRGLMVLAIAIGAAAAWYSGKKVPMTGMPQMVALYNGMGGGAAAGIAAVELIKHDVTHSTGALFLAVVGGLIGAVSFSGSMVAFGKLQELFKRGALLDKEKQRYAYYALGVIALICGLFMVLGNAPISVVMLFFAVTLVLGVLVTMPIGGADMPVVISLYNALTGLAVGFEGFVLNNAAMIIAGTVVGAAGTLLTQLMAKAMNRSITNILFSGLGTVEVQIDAEKLGEMKAIEGNDAAIMMAFAEKVVIVPGYGMAVAQAQHKIWEMSELLEERGVRVKFAIHPVAGRMPGHMNVLLAEAGVPYDKIYDLEDINPEFPQTDVALVIGANDVVNPDARTNKTSPIYGMPILDVDKAKNCIVIKRGRGTGFSGVENTLFFSDNTRMLFGDGQKAAGELIREIKALN